MKPAIDTSDNNAKQGLLLDKKDDVGIYILNGSYLKGQLIDECNEQETMNGQILC